MKVDNDINMDDIAKKNNMTLSELQKFLDLVKKGMKPCAKRVLVAEDGVNRYFTVERRGVGKIKTPYGDFWQYSFAVDDQWEKYSVLVKAEIDKQSLNPIFKNKHNLIVRTDSGCETSQVFNDLTCECEEQLKLAMKTIANEGEGMIMHIPKQDGRGMGLPFKLATLWLQENLKVNTVESALILAPGGTIDVRTYSGVICILKFFKITPACQISLATNNPKKAEVFIENGYTVKDYIAVRIEPNDNTRRHLRAKQKHLGHLNLVKEDQDENC